MTNPIGCDIHEMYTDYPLLLSRMDFIACRTGQGAYQPDAAYARHKKAIIGKRPLLAWHVQKPWQSALAQVDAFLKIQPPEEGVRHSWDCELEWQSQAAVTDHLAEIMRLMLAKTGLYPIVYSGKWFIDPWIDVSALPPETKWWLAEYAEKKYGWYVNRGSGGYTIVDDRLHFPLSPIAGIKPENVLIHQPTSNANGRIWGAWTAADGRLDIDFWLQGGKEGMMQWFGLSEGDNVPIEIKPEPPAPETPLFDAVVSSTATPYLNIRSASNAAATIVGRAYPGDKVSVFETTDSLKPWYRIDPGKWLAGWYTTRISDEPLHSASPLWQRDPRWASAKLGTSNTTIGDYGCLLTCITMLVNEYLKTSYTPPQMNAIINKVNGFVSGNLFRFASLWEAFPNQIGADKLIRTPLTPAPLSEVDAVLADGRPVIVETRMNKVSQHWVLITGKREGRYVCNDPWTGKTVVFEDVYGDAARWIYSIVSYRRK